MSVTASAVTRVMASHTAIAREWGIVSMEMLPQGWGVWRREEEVILVLESLLWNQHPREPQVFTLQTRSSLEWQALLTARQVTHVLVVVRVSMEMEENQVEKGFS